MRLTSGLGSLVLLAAAGLSSCREAPPPAPTSVLLVTVDTLRPDALGWIGGHGRTPAADELAREGVAFDGAVAPAPLTLPSHAAMLTGRLPRRLGLRDNGQLVPEVPTLAGELRARGFSTAAFVSGYPLAASFGLDRGFDHYDDRFTRDAKGGLERTAPDTTVAAAAWLRAAPPPFFLWVHYYDPHFPYEPPERLRTDGQRGAYDGEVALVDEALRALRKAVPRGPVLTVFAADHGESLGEHGENTHGFFVYDSTIRVPLVLHFPGRLSPRRSTAAARLVDLTPTVLDLLGMPVPEGLDGTSLAPALDGHDPDLPAYVETYQPWTSYGWSPLRALRAGGLKLIDAPRPELYDLRADPGEERDLHGERPRLAAAMRRRLDEIAAGPAAPSRAADDTDASERLAALGYLGGGSSVEPPASGLRDPKDGLALRERLTEGDVALRAGRAAAALPHFDAVLDADPDNRFALLRSAAALIALGRPERAEPPLRRSVELDPDRPEARMLLADALGRRGRAADAAEQWAEAVRLQPRNARLWANLGSSLGQAGRTEDAVEALGKAVSLAPADPRLLARLAFGEVAAGRPGDAIEHLRRAAEMTKPSPFPHAGALGVLLVRAGRGSEAEPWLRAARRDDGDFAEARLELARLLAPADPEGARGALSEALSADPRLRARAAADPALSGLR